MRWLPNFPELLFDGRLKHAAGARITILLLACIFLLSTYGITMSQCPYVIGDVNGNGVATPLADVVYFVCYLKDLGNPPPIACDMCTQQTPPFYAAADVNGNCEVRGTDVTYMVAYYEGLASQLMYCPTCPPSSFRGKSNTIGAAGGGQMLLTQDPNDFGDPDSVRLGDGDPQPITVHLGETIIIPVWVKNDEEVPALNLSIASHDNYVLPGSIDSVSAPLDTWGWHFFVNPEADQPSPGWTSQTLLAWAYLGGPDTPPNLNTQGSWQRIAVFTVTVNSNPSNIGTTTEIVFGNNSRAAGTKFCSVCGTKEWTPSFKTLTLYIQGGSPLISGTVYQNNDGDCVQNQGETGLANRFVTLHSNSSDYVTTTDWYGTYSVSSLPPGVYTVTEVPETNWEQLCPTLSPGTHTVNLGVGQYATGNDFSDRRIQEIADLWCSASAGQPRPGFSMSYGIRYMNRGSLDVDATVELALPASPPLPPDAVVFSFCSPGGTYNPGNHTVSWDIGIIHPGGMGWVSATVLISPTIPIRTILTSTVTILPIAGDANPDDNVQTISQEVTGSFDPNEKLVSPVGEIEPTDMLTYQINFQNVGNDTAFNIIVRDTLDVDIDITTFESGASIHPYTYAIKGREISWTFANINLPDSIVNEPASHGFVKFTVSPVPSVHRGAVIENRALVYFDFNLPVVTNTVSSVIAGAPACLYLSGDINGDDLRGGGDVTYGVRFFKLIGNRPPDSCYLDSTHAYLYVAGDANGNCEFRGSDISRLVAYFKLIAPLQYCHFFPPPPLREKSKILAPRD